MIRSIVAPVLAALFYVTASGAVTEETPAKETVVEVQIRDYKYLPAELRIKVGTTVRWLNAEKRTSHSILFLGESSLESERIFPEEHWDRKFDLPGEYVYSCGPHPEMHGRIVVE